MKASTLILAIGIIVAFTMGRASSDEATDSGVDALREDVKKLSVQVDFLLADRRMEPEDLDVLAQRVKSAELIQNQTEALFNAGGPLGSAEQLHRANAAYRLARGRLNFAKKQYDTCMNDFNSALVASNQARVVLENKFDAGTVTLSDLIRLQESVADIQLERNRLRRQIRALANQDF